MAEESFSTVLIVDVVGPRMGDSAWDYLAERLTEENAEMPVFVLRDNHVPVEIRWSSNEYKFSVPPIADMIGLATPIASGSSDVGSQRRVLIELLDTNNGKDLAAFVNSDIIRESAMCCYVQDVHDSDVPMCLLSLPEASGVYVEVKDAQSA